MPETKQESLSDKTIHGMRQVVDRSLSYVQGLEKTIVSGAVRVLYPRIEERIRQAPEDDLRAELRYLHDLLGTILNQTPKKATSSKRSRIRRR